MISFAVFLYLGFQFLIGLWVSRRIQDDQDYFLAGRNLNVGMASFSIFATWFGAETCIGSSAAVFGGGLAESRAEPFGYAVCLFLVAILFASPLWRRKLTTIGDLFRKRFSPSVEKFAVIILIGSSMIWAAAQIRAFGQILAVISPIDPNLGIALAAGIVIAYTFLGGLLGDVITDTAQGFILIIGLVFLFVLTLGELGGVGEALSQLKPERLSLAGPDESWLSRLNAWTIPIVGSLFTQELLTRIFASKTKSVARRATVFAGMGYLALGLIPVTLGLLGPQILATLPEQDQFLPTLARQILPDVLFVIFIGALISAILSTVDSTLLSASAFVANNLLHRRYEASDGKGRLRMARASIVGAGVIAFILAVYADGIYDLVVAASEFGTAGTVTLTLAALWLPRLGSARVAMAALVLGVITSPIYDALGFEAPYIAAILTTMSAYLGLAVLEQYILEKEFRRKVINHLRSFLF